jgi:anti-sigma regulatory factor (Ser/Thr protein kinase)
MARSQHRTPGHEQTDSARRVLDMTISLAGLEGLRAKVTAWINRLGAAQVRDDAAQVRDDAAQVRDDAAQVRDDAAQVRDDAAQVRDDAVLVAHELATNVIRHGGGFGRLRMWRESGRIVCRVSDCGPGMPALVAEPETRRPGGRGLWIARRLADVRIESGPSGTVVVAAMAL